jgi:hypothetical protein
VTKSLALSLLLLSAAPLFADDPEGEAVRAVEKIGGVVIRDDKAPGSPVVEVQFKSPKVTDADLGTLSGLPDCKVKR